MTDVAAGDPGPEVNSSADVAADLAGDVSAEANPPTVAPAGNDPVGNGSAPDTSGSDQPDSTAASGADNTALPEGVATSGPGESSTSQSTSQEPVATELPASGDASTLQADSSSSDTAETPTAALAQAEQPRPLRVMWIDAGGAAQSFATDDLAELRGFAMGLLRDGRNRDVTLVDDDTEDASHVRTDAEVMAF